MNFGSWVLIFVWQETRCFDAVAELYADLGEEDVLAGLWKRKGTAEESRAALAAMQHGLLPRAQTSFTNALLKSDKGSYAAAGEGPAAHFTGERLASMLLSHASSLAQDSEASYIKLALVAIPADSSDAGIVAA